LAQAAKDAYNDPSLVTDTVTGMGSGIKSGAKAVKDAVTDPQKILDAAKNVSGYKNFENSWDPNRSLPDRIGQVGLGVANLYGTITTAGAVGSGLKNGATNLVGRLAGEGGGAAVADGATVAGETLSTGARAGEGAVTTGARAGEGAAATGAGAGEDAAAGARAARTGEGPAAGATGAGEPPPPRGAAPGETPPEPGAAGEPAGPKAGGQDVAPGEPAGGPKGRDKWDPDKVTDPSTLSDAEKAKRQSFYQDKYKEKPAAPEPEAPVDPDAAAQEQQRLDDLRQRRDQNWTRKEDVSQLSDEEKMRRQSYEQNLGNRAGGKGSTIRPGSSTDFTPADGANVDELTAGYTRTSEIDIQMVADKYGVNIHTRPTTARASELLAAGEALPKPELIKNKTINQWDTYLGAKLDEVGKVGHFMPEPPPVRSACPDLTDKQYDKVVERYFQRADEFHAQDSYLAHHADAVRLDGRLVIDQKTGLPFTGDVDGYAVRGLNNEPLPKAVVQQVERELKNGPGDVMHGVHTEWDYSHLQDPASPTYNPQKFGTAQTIDVKIRGSHAPGGESLVTYSAGGTKPGASVWNGGTRNPLIKPPTAE